MTKHVIIVSGWRGATRKDHGLYIADVLWKYVYGKHGMDVVLREGECPQGGVDAIARMVGEHWGWEIDPMPADWDTFGTVAGPIRNEAMCAKGADELLPFPGPDPYQRRGTMHCIAMALNYGIPIRGPFYLT